MLKKCCLLLLCGLLLTGCSAPTFETLGDVLHQQADAPTPRKVVLTLPQNAVQTVWSQDGDTLYLCENYEAHLQTLSGGDLQTTVRQLSGFDKDKLTLVESSCGDHDRYEWVWIAAGEGGDAVYRCAVLSDGNFHYALTLSALAADAGSLTDQWNSLMASFCLAETE